MASSTRHFQPYFTATCIILRENAEASEAKVADLVGRDSSAIKRFEKGKSWPAPELEKYAAGYAELTKDWNNPLSAWDLLNNAFQRWLKWGDVPLSAGQSSDIEVTITPQDIVRAIRDAEKQEQVREQTESPPNATRKNRASGE